MWTRYRPTIPAPTDGWKQKKPNQEEHLCTPARPPGRPVEPAGGDDN